MMTYRAKLADENYPDAYSQLDCGTCLAKYDASHRKHLRCYWVPEAERCGMAARPPRWKGELDVCAGGLVQLPQVVEAARASSWRKEGALREFYDGRPLTELAKTCIDVIAAETVAAHNDAIRARNEG